MIVGVSPSAAGIVADYATKLLGGRTRIISNDRALAKALRDLGSDAVALPDLIPINSELDLSAYAASYAFIERVGKLLGSCVYRGVALSGAVEAWLFNTLILLEKSAPVLADIAASHEHAVFAMAGWEHSYLALWDIAHQEGRIASDDLCLSLESGRLAPWSAFSERRIETYVDAIHDAGPLTCARLVRAGRRAGRHAVHQEAGPRVTTLFFLRTNEYVLYLKPIVPLLKEFRKNGESYSVVTVDPLVVKNLDPVGVESLLLENLSDDSSDPEHLRLLHAGGLHRLEKALETVHSQLKASSPVGTAALRYCSGDVFQRRVLEDMRLVDALIDVIRAQRPRSVMIAPDAIPTARVVAAVAARFELPTVTTLAGSVSSSIRHMGVYYADTIAVAGEDDRDAFLAAGYDPQRLVPTGSPMLDSIANASQVVDRAYVSERIPLDPSKRIVLIASSQLDPKESTWIRAFGQAARRRADVEIVVKCHPNYPLERYADSIDAAKGLPVHFIRDIDLHPLLNLSSAVITDYSHAGKEALLFGKPLIVFNFTGTPYPTNRYDELGVALLVTDVSEIDSAMDRIIEDETLLARLERRRTEVVVNRFNYRNDGRASERILQLLRNGTRRRSEVRAAS